MNHPRSISGLESCQTKQNKYFLKCILLQKKNKFQQKQCLLDSILPTHRSKEFGKKNAIQFHQQNCAQPYQQTQLARSYAQILLSTPALSNPFAIRYNYFVICHQSTFQLDWPSKIISIELVLRVTFHVNCCLPCKA